MRILFHYTHKQTLGHTTRSAALASAICRRKDTKLTVLQGGVPQPFIRFPKDCQVIDIPYPFDTRSSFQTRPETISAGQRAKFVLQTAADLSPDVFITEFYPFGRSNYTQELLATLRFLRKKGVRIISSIGYPLISDLERLQDRTFFAFFIALLGLYDDLLIHTPLGLEDPYYHRTITNKPIADLYAAVMKKLAPKITNTGYIFPEPVIVNGDKIPAMEGSLPLVVVSRGGGAVYPNIILKAIEAHRLLKQRTRMIIACGPATTPEETTLFRQHLKPQDEGNIVLAGHLDNLSDLLRNAQASISLSGYNTSVQLMRFGTPSILVPYRSNASKNTTNDQIARAQLMQERFNSSILSYDDLTPQVLASAIEEQMSRVRPKPAPENWFGGADTSAKLIA